MIRSLLLSLTILTGTALAQFVTITGTVDDPNGNPYQNGSGRAVLVSGNGSGQQAWTINQTNPVQTPIVINALDSFGKFSVQLASTAIIDQQAAQPKWQFCFAANQAIQPQVSFCMTPLALASNQDISTQIKAQSAFLPGGGGGATNATALQGRPLDASVGAAPNCDYLYTNASSWLPQAPINWDVRCSGGADFGAQLQDCVTNRLAASGGVCDARGIAVGSAVATVNLTKQVAVLFGNGAYTFNGCPGINVKASGATLLGIGMYATLLHSGCTSDNLITADNANNGGFGLLLEKLQLYDDVRSTRSAGHGLYATGTSSNVVVTYRDGFVYGFEDGIHLNRPITSLIERVQANAQLNDNFAIVGSGTSTTLINTYGSNAGRYCYNWSGNMAYSAMVNTACDHAGSHGYWFGTAVPTEGGSAAGGNNITLMAPGCETAAGSCYLIDSWQMVTMTSPFCTGATGDCLTTAATNFSARNIKIINGRFVDATGWGINLPHLTANTFSLDGYFLNSNMAGTLSDPDHIADTSNSITDQSWHPINLVLRNANYLQATNAAGSGTDNILAADPFDRAHFGIDIGVATIANNLSLTGRTQAGSSTFALIGPTTNDHAQVGQTGNPVDVPDQLNAFAKIALQTNNKELFGVDTTAGSHRMAVIDGSNTEIFGATDLATKFNGTSFAFGTAFGQTLNFAGTLTSPRTATWPDKDITIAGLVDVPELYNHSGTIQAASHTVQDSCVLGTSCSVTLTGSAVFTSSTSYTCVCQDNTAIDACNVVQSSGSAFAITGTGTDTIRYICTGN